jgi:hypothetical protein
MWDRQKQLIRLLDPYFDDNDLVHQFSKSADIYNWQKKFISIEIEVEKFFLHKRRAFDELKKSLDSFHCKSFLVAPLRQDLNFLVNGQYQYHSLNNVTLELEELSQKIDEEQHEVDRRLKTIRRFFWERLQILSTEASVKTAKKMDRMTEIIIAISAIALLLTFSDIYIGFVIQLIASWIADLVGVVRNVLERLSF